MAERDPFLASIEEAIANVERRSSAELVVAVTPWSGSYHDLEIATGAVLAYAVLLLVLCVHGNLWVWLIPLQLILTGGVGYLLARLSPDLRRILARPRRRARQVDAEAARAFHEEAVSATHNRTGLLFFVSLGERQFRIIADQGLLARIPPSEWVLMEMELLPQVSGLKWTEQVTTTIRRIGDRLAADFPIDPDDANEITNQVRIRS